jgi:hypothetical protein
MATLKNSDNGKKKNVLLAKNKVSFVVEVPTPKLFFCQDEGRSSRGFSH